MSQQRVDSALSCAQNFLMGFPGQRATFFSVRTANGELRTIPVVDGGGEPSLDLIEALQRAEASLSHIHPPDDLNSIHPLAETMVEEGGDDMTVTVEEGWVAPTVNACAFPSGSPAPPSLPATPSATKSSPPLKFNTVTHPLTWRSKQGNIAPGSPETSATTIPIPLTSTTISTSIFDECNKDGNRIITAYDIQTWPTHLQSRCSPLALRLAVDPSPSQQVSSSGKTRGGDFIALWITGSDAAAECEARGVVAALPNDPNRFEAAVAGMLKSASLETALMLSNALGVPVLALLAAPNSKIDVKTVDFDTGGDTCVEDSLWAGVMHALEKSGVAVAFLGGGGLRPNEAVVTSESYTSCVKAVLMHLLQTAPLQNRGEKRSPEEKSTPVEQVGENSCCPTACAFILESPSSPLDTALFSSLLQRSSSSSAPFQGSSPPIWEVSGNTIVPPWVCDTWEREEEEGFHAAATAVEGGSDYQSREMQGVPEGQYLASLMESLPQSVQMQLFTRLCPHLKPPTVPGRSSSNFNDDDDDDEPQSINKSPGFSTEVVEDGERNKRGKSEEVENYYFKRRGSSFVSFSEFVRKWEKSRLPYFLPEPFQEKGGELLPQACRSQVVERHTRGVAAAAIKIEPFCEKWLERLKKSLVTCLGEVRGMPVKMCDYNSPQSMMLLHTQFNVQPRDRVWERFSRLCVLAEMGDAVASLGVIALLAREHSLATLRSAFFGGASIEGMASGARFSSSSTLRGQIKLQEQLVLDVTSLAVSHGTGMFFSQENCNRESGNTRNGLSPPPFSTALKSATTEDALWNEALVEILRPSPVSDVANGTMELEGSMDGGCDSDKGKMETTNAEPKVVSCPHTLITLLREARLLAKAPLWPVLLPYLTYRLGAWQAQVKSGPYLPPSSSTSACGGVVIGSSSTDPTSHPGPIHVMSWLLSGGASGGDQVAALTRFSLPLTWVWEMTRSVT